MFVFRRNVGREHCLRRKIAFGSMVGVAIRPRTKRPKSDSSANAAASVQPVQFRLNVTKIDQMRPQFGSVASEKRRRQRVKGLVAAGRQV